MEERTSDVEMCTAHSAQEVGIMNNKGHYDFHETLEDDFRVLKYDFDKTSTPALPRTQSLKALHFGHPLYLRPSSTPLLGTNETLRHKSHTNLGQLQCSSSPFTDSAFEEISSCKLDFHSSEGNLSHAAHSDLPVHSRSAENLSSKPNLPNSIDSSTAGYQSSGYHSLGFSSIGSPEECPNSIPNIPRIIPASYVMHNSLLFVKNVPNELQVQPQRTLSEVPCLPIPMELSTDTILNNPCGLPELNSGMNDCSNLRTDTVFNNAHKTTSCIPFQDGISNSITTLDNRSQNQSEEHSSDIQMFASSVPAAEMEETSETTMSSLHAIPDVCNTETNQTACQKSFSADTQTTSNCDSNFQQWTHSSTVQIMLHTAKTIPKLPVVNQALTPLQHERLKAVIAQHSPAVPDRLIGRRIGLEKIDILKELSAMSLSPVIAAIMKMMRPEDLLRMCRVSPDWKSLVESDSHASRRKNLALSERTRQAELLQKENLVDKDSRRQVRNLTEGGLPFGTLQYKQSRSLLSPVKINAATKNPAVAHQRYWKAASKLKNHESLRKCPHCQQPAKHHKEMEKASCCNPQCQYTFCTNCFNAFHGSTACSSTLGKRNKLSTPIGSVKSKKNLKRL